MKNVEKSQTTKERQKLQGSAEPAGQVAVGQPPGTQDQESLAKKFGVEVKTVALIREVVADVLAEGDSAITVTPEIEQLVEQAADKRLQELVVVVRDLIEKATGQKLPKEQTGSDEYSPEREAVAGVREALKQRPATFRKEVLSAMLSDVEKTTNKVEELQAMEGKVRAIIDNLDPKTKAVVTVLLKLAAVDGYGVDIDYGYRLLFETLNDPDLVEAAIKKLPNDVDLSYLAEACRVAQCIMDLESSDDEPDPGSDDEAEAESEAVEEVAPKTQREEAHEAIDNLAAELGEMQQAKQAEPKLCKPEIMLKEWLLGQNYKTKLACVIMGTLMFDDHGTGKLANELINKFDEEIMATAANPPDGLPNDELLMTGVVVEQGIWHEHY